MIFGWYSVFGPCEVAQETAQAVRNLACPGLEVLVLSNNPFFGDDEIPLGCRGLIALGIHFTAVTDIGCRAILAACPRLRLLDVHQCKSVTEEQRVSIQSTGIALADIDPLFFAKDVEDVLKRPHQRFFCSNGGCSFCAQTGTS